MAYGRLLCLICCFLASLIDKIQTATVTGSGGIKSFQFSAYPSCGTTNPTYVYECTNSSTNSNSCCYYSYGSLTGCFLLDYVSQSTLSPGKLTIICSDTVIRLGYLLVLIIVTLILI